MNYINLMINKQFFIKLKLKKYNLKLKKDCIFKKIRYFNLFIHNGNIK